MRSFKISTLPLTLATLMTSSMVYGAAPYTIGSSVGGPVKDELGEIVSVSEAKLNQLVSYKARIINTSDTLQGSLWQVYENKSLTDAFPIGSKTVTVQFTLTNQTSYPVDVYGLFIKGWYENSDWLASPVIPASKAKHVELGYREHLLDYFGNDASQWMIGPNQSLSFAETFYVDNDKEPLNLEIVIPKQGNPKEIVSSAKFRLYS